MVDSSVTIYTAHSLEACLVDGRPMGGWMQVVRELKTHSRLLLTGTPLQVRLLSAFFSSHGRHCVRRMERVHVGRSIYTLLSPKHRFSTPQQPFTFWGSWVVEHDSEALTFCPTPEGRAMGSIAGSDSLLPVSFLPLVKPGSFWFTLLLNTI